MPAILPAFVPGFFAGCFYLSAEDLQTRLGRDGPADADSDADSDADTDSATDTGHDSATDTASDSGADSGGDSGKPLPTDNDGDGVFSDLDCNDGDATVFPGSHATETPKDGIDTDCDGNDDCDDLNCDGWPDLIVTNSYAPDGGVGDSKFFFGPFSAAGAASELSVISHRGGPSLAKDLDGNGYLDVVIGSDLGEVGEDTFVYWGGPTGPAETATALFTEDVYEICAADLDHNGGLDLVFTGRGPNTSPEGNSYIYWYKGGYSPANVTLLPSHFGRSCQIADFDADGLDDIVIVNMYAVDSYDIDSYVFWGSTDYSVDGSTALPTHGGTRAYVADLDGDLDTDIFISGYYTSVGPSNVTDSYIYWNNGGKFNASVRKPLAGEGTQYAAIADLDGGGSLDIVTASVTDGVTYADRPVTIWNGESGFTSATTTIVDGGKLVTTVDLDNDGDLDILVGSAGDGITKLSPVTIFWNNGGFTDGDSTALPGEAPFRHVEGDLSGDGWPDVVVTNSTNDTGYSTESYLYFGSPSGFAETNRAVLPIGGVFGTPTIVGSID